MSYKKLRNFQSIINRKDFNYISDNKKIKDDSDKINDALNDILGD